MTPPPPTPPPPPPPPPLASPPTALFNSPLVAFLTTLVVIGFNVRSAVQKALRVSTATGKTERVVGTSRQMKKSTRKKKNKKKKH